MAHFIRGYTCKWQVKSCDSSLTRAIPAALCICIALTIKRYTNVLLTIYFTQLRFFYKTLNLATANCFSGKH